MSSGPEVRRAFSIVMVSVDPDGNTISFNGRTVRLEPKVMDLLDTIAGSTGETLSRADLIDRVWGVQYGGDESLSRAVSLIRKAFADLGADDPIETVPRRGYRLAQVAVRPVAEPAEATPVSSRRSRSLSPNAWFAAAAAGLVAAILAAGLDRPDKGQPAADLYPARFDVAAFEAVPDHPDGRRLIEAASREILEDLRIAKVDLSAGEGFLVKVAASAGPEKWTLRADFVATGSGRVVWTASQSAPDDEIAALPKTFALLVAETAACFSYWRNETSQPATEEFVRRLYDFCEASHRGNWEYWMRTESLGRRLVDAAPNEPVAHIAYALSAAILSRYLFPEEPELARRRVIVAEHVERAKALGSTNRLTELALAMVNDDRLSLAQRERLIAEAVAAEPDFHFGRKYLSHYYANVGRIADARAVAEQQVANFPLDWMMRGYLAVLYADTNRLNLVESSLRFAEGLAPGVFEKAPFAGFIETWIGDPERARTLAHLDARDDPHAHCLSMFLDARVSGVRPSAEAIERACAHGWLDAPRHVYGYFGYLDEAYADVEEQLGSKYATMHEINPWGMRGLFRPHMKAVRADERFMPFMARVGLAQYWLETEEWPDFCDLDPPPYDCRLAAQAAIAALKDG